MNFRRSLETTTNVAIIVLAIFVIGNFLLGRIKPREDNPAPLVGAKVDLKGAKWEENSSTLLLVLQKGCRYCEESAAFYHRLYDERAQRSKPKIIAVIPGDKTESSHYLLERDILVDDVISTPLSAIKVSATPTLLLVDRSGRVSNVWVGKLNESKEREVIRQAFDSDLAKSMNFNSPTTLR